MTPDTTEWFPRMMWHIFEGSWYGLGLVLIVNLALLMIVLNLNLCVRATRQAKWCQ